MLQVCFAIAIIALIISAILIFIYHKNFGLSVRILLLGSLVIITTLIIPIYHLDTGKYGYDTVSSILFSILYGLRALAGCQSVTLTQEISIDTPLYYAYYAVMYSAFVLALLFTSAFLISVFGNLMDIVRYKLMLGKNIYIFSELNDITVDIAKSLDAPSARFIFCNHKLSNAEKDSSLVRRSREIGSIILEKSEDDIQIKGSSDRHYTFFMISNNKDTNLSKTLKLLSKHNALGENRVSIVTFATGNYAEKILDNTDKGNVIVKLIDEAKYTCYSLLDSEPLFEHINDGTLSMLIVGLGTTGQEMLKAALWCGQLIDTKIKITAIDMKAEKVKNQLMRDYPGLFENDNYEVNFYNHDVNDKNIDSLLKEHCLDTYYVVVATESDQLNIETAVYLRQFFMRTRGNTKTQLGMYIRIKDSQKSMHLDNLLNNTNCDYDFHSFGSYNKLFTASNVMGTNELERMALNVHLTYYGKALEGNEEDLKYALHDYNATEYTQRSSFASALHIKYKMYSVNVHGMNGEPITDAQADEFAEIIKNDDGTLLNKLACLEHMRWNSYMQSEGYVSATPEDVRSYCTYVAKDSVHHVNNIAKLHPCIVEDWDSLDSISTEISTILSEEYAAKYPDKPVKNFKKDFKQYDIDLVKNIPAIVKAR